ARHDRLRAGYRQRQGLPRGEALPLREGPPGGLTAPPAPPGDVHGPGVHCAAVAAAELTIREGGVADLAATFELSERAMHAVAVRQGVVPGDVPLSDARIRSDWLRQRALIEFLAAQPEGRYLLCEGADGLVGYARAVRFGGMEQVTEL